MKKYVLVAITALLSMSCNGQKREAKDSGNTVVEQPKGSWKVDKEFDDQGNLIRYDSIYSWSSGTKIDDLSTVEKDSMMHAFKSRFFTNFSAFKNQGFDTIFSPDSLFTKHFFNDDFFRSDFGKDVMDIDKIRQQMLARQKRFLEKYHSNFMKPEDEN